MEWCLREGKGGGDEVKILIWRNGAFTTKDITFLGGKNGRWVSARSRQIQFGGNREVKEVNNFWVEKRATGRREIGRGSPM